MEIALANTVVLYGPLLAGLVFTALGVWMGSRLVRKKREPVEQFVMNESARAHLRITIREIEGLALMSGCR
jgi:hypothetical protein